MPQRLLLLLMILAAAIAPRGIAASEAAVVTVRTGEHAGYSRIVFDWDSPVAASIVRNGKGELIVTFGRAATFDLRKAPTRKLTRIKAIVPGNDGASVAIVLRRNATYEILNYDNTVVIDVVSHPAAEVTKNINKKETIPSQSTSIAESGIEGLAFRRAGEPGAVAGLQTTAPATDTVPPPSPPALTGPLPSPLFDVAAWRGGDDFLTAYRSAEASFADAESAEGLLKLARLQFAWRHADEGLAMLQRLIVQEPALAKRADVAALGEALALQSSRPAARSHAFSSPLFDKTPEGLLWRGAADAADGRWQTAAQNFTSGLKTLAAYPAEFRTDLALTAAETGLKAGDTRLAGAALNLAEKSLDDPTARAEWNALKGLQLLNDRDAQGAEPYLSAAAASDAQRPRIQAQLGLIDIGRKSGRLSPDDAATELEALTYVWQGDELQLQILDRLIGVQASLGRYDRALEAADAAVTASADDAAAQRRYRDRMGELLEAAFAASESDGGDKVSAIALFHRYGEMLPEKTQRVDLGLKLADQLAAADLAAQAADVLRDLKAPGIQETEIAARLAEPTAATAPAAESMSSTAVQAEPSTGDAVADADELWRGKRWSEAADGYLVAIAQSEGKSTETTPRLILRAAAALLLAGRNQELASLRQDYSGEMTDNAFAELFDRLTTPGADYSLLIAPDMAQALTASK